MVNLDGTVSGGLPGTVTSEWSLDSSPPGATVDFGNVSEVDTTATFYEPGEYVLELTAGDGLVTAEDTVTITIRQLPFVEAGEYEPITPPVNFVNLQGENTDGMGEEDSAQSRCHEKWKSLQFTQSFVKLLGLNGGNYVF